MLKLSAIMALALTVSTTATTAGSHYDEGVNAYKTGDYSKAAGHYRQAALHGSVMAQHNLASMYFMGQGVTENPIMAYMWEQIAVENGLSGGRGFLEMYGFQLSHDEIKSAQHRATTCARSLYRDCDVPTIQ